MTDQITAASLVANLRDARAKIEAITDDGSYVLMCIAHAIFFVEGRTMAGGVQHATRYASKAAAARVPTVRNGNGERFWPTEIAVAKAAAIADLDKAIEGFTKAMEPA